MSQSVCRSFVHTKLGFRPGSGQAVLHFADDLTLMLTDRWSWWSRPLWALCGRYFTPELTSQGFYWFCTTAAHKLNCLWWRGVFHICVGECTILQIGVRYLFSRISRRTWCCTFYLRSGRWTHLLSQINGETDFVFELRAFSVSSKHAVSQLVLCTIQDYQVLLLRNKDKCSRFKSSLSLLFLSEMILNLVSSSLYTSSSDHVPCSFSLWRAHLAYSFLQTTCLVCTVSPNSSTAHETKTLRD